MNFDDLDKKMRIYEQSIDQSILPDMYLVARLDGRSFSRLTKEICDFEAPFDVRFRDMMVNTVKALMECGFRVVYGFTESDEISLLFHKEENTFGRKVRKFNSILAGQASAAFSLQLGQVIAMDCRPPAQFGEGTRLFPLETRGCAQKCPECSLLLDAAQRRNGRPNG